jgi:hypothetical protein
MLPTLFALSYMTSHPGNWLILALTVYVCAEHLLLVRRLDWHR